MALSLPQQLWLKRAYVGDIVEKLRLQVFTIEDLREFALANPASKSIRLSWRLWPGLPTCGR